MKLFSDSKKLNGNYYAILSMLLWSTGFPISEALLDVWDPLSLTFVRLIGAGIFLGICTLLFSKPYDLTTWPLKEAFLVGVIGTGFGTAFMNFGFRYSNPFNIAVISTMIPLISMIMGTIQKTERLTSRMAAAIFLSLIGGIMISVSNLENGSSFEGGEILMLISIILWTWSMRQAVSLLLPIPTLPRVTLTMLSGAVVLVPIMALVHWLGITELVIFWSTTDIILVSWLSIFSIGLATVVWYLSAESLGPTVAAIHLNIVPFYVLIITVFMGGEILITQILGAVLVGVGVVTAQISRKQI